MKRLTALLLALMLLLPAACAVSLAEGAEKGYLGKGIQEKAYAADTLPGGMFPYTRTWEPRLYREDPDTRTRGAGDPGEKATSVRVEWVSGDYSAEEAEAIFPFVDGYLLTRYDLLNRPGALTVRVVAESPNLRAQRVFTISVVDFSWEPFEIPEGTAEMYAQKGRLDAYTAAEACGQILPGNMAFVEKDMDGAQFESPWVNLASADTYELLIRCEYLGACYYLPVRVFVNLKPDAKKGVDEAETVKNFRELKAAICEKNRNRIVIAAAYKHGSPEDNTITIRHGRTVTISPEEGKDAAVITGSLRLKGSARVVFDRVSVEAKDGDPGLIVEEGMDVTAVSVKGGDSKRGHGGPGVYVTGGRVKIEEARGGSSVNGLGGDAVVADGSATVEVVKAVGGSSAKGAGGAGVIALNGAEVTVTGGTTGGNGGAAAGKGVLAGPEGTVNVEGKQNEGETPASAGEAAEEISGDTALYTALRSGKTELVLSPKFSALPAKEPVALFTLTEEPVRITVAGEQTAKTRDMEWKFTGGKWEVAGIEASGAGKKVPLRVGGRAEVDWTGDLKSASAAVSVSDRGILRLTGKADSNSKDTAAVSVTGGGRLEMTGDIAMKADPSALAVTGGGNVKLNGSVTNIQGKEAAVYLEGGRLEMKGTLTPGASCYGLRSISGEVLFDGSIAARSSRFFGVYVHEGVTLVTGEIKGKLPFLSTLYGHLFINGKNCHRIGE